MPVSYKIPKLLWALAISLIGWSGISNAETPVANVQKQVVYGQGAVDVSTERRLRPLLLDAYLPKQTAANEKPHPAIILAFGGAFHRGGKGDYQFSEDGASDSSMADYCQALADRGIACFSIDYRLTPEDPAFPEGLEQANLMSKELLSSPIVTGRVEIVRKRMSLPPLDDRSREQLWNATFAAVEDLETALNFIRKNADSYGIDPDRIAVGGFSAGAITAINLAYGKGVDVQAVVSLSGTSWGYDLGKTVTDKAPPLLIVAGQWDLAGIREGSAGITKLFVSRNVPTSQAWVPGFGHFYPKEAPSLSSQFDKVSVIDRLVQFLDRNLHPSAD
ncbi:alpha/beta hydrolase fold domain-containing protein [Parasphingorhabdus sp.]|uniref:alpha/beta hydrolase n=1 Tax=Parasphingorhabdus sp. TaxID=2709688 RepID=UPI003265EAC7